LVVFRSEDEIVAPQAEANRVARQRNARAETTHKGQERRFVAGVSAQSGQQRLPTLATLLAVLQAPL
jgi:hypothetical protein